MERFDELFKNRSLGWDGDGGRSPPLPFCEMCKKELIGLREKENRLDGFGWYIIASKLSIYLHIILVL